MCPRLSVYDGVSQEFLKALHVYERRRELLLKMRKRFEQALRSLACFERDARTAVNGYGKGHLLLCLKTRIVEPERRAPSTSDA